MIWSLSLPKGLTHIQQFVMIRLAESQEFICVEWLSLEPLTFMGIVKEYQEEPL